MDLTQIVTLVTQRLGNRDDLIPLVENEVRFQQEYTLERDPIKPWFLVGEVAVTPTVGVAHFDIPDNVIHEYEDGGLYQVLNGQYYELGKGNFTELQSLLREDSYSRLRAYAVRGTRIHLFPTPTESIDLRMIAYLKQPTLEGETVENAWTKYAADWLVAAAGSAVAQHIQHAVQMKVFGSQLVAARKRVEAETTAREAMNGPTLADSSLGGLRIYNDTDLGA